MNASLLTNFLRPKWHIKETFLPWTQSAKMLNRSFPNHQGAPVPPAAEPCGNPEVSATHLHVGGGMRGGRGGGVGGKGKRELINRVPH